MSIVAYGNYEVTGPVMAWGSYDYTSGFGALPGDEGCPEGTSRLGIPGGPCINVSGDAGTPGCNPPQIELWPNSGICLDPVLETGEPTPQAGICPTGQIGWPPYVPCTAIPGEPQPEPAQAPSQCPDGQVGFPLYGIPCIPVSGVPQTAPPQMPNACPSGQVGWPPFFPCTAIPNVPNAPPPTAGCPAGSMGIPPHCVPFPGPGGVPQAAPAPAPGPTPRADAPKTTVPAKAGSAWLLWVAGAAVVAGGVYYATRKPKRATPNRRRRR